MSLRYPLEEIKERCDLVEVVSQYVALRRSGSTLKGLCPFHNEKTPSFHVNPQRQIWHCYGCGEGGDVFSFVQKMDNITFPEAVELLARKAGVEIVRSPQAARELDDRERILRANNIACTFFRAALTKSGKVRDYLAKRGLTSASIEKYKLGYAPDSWDELSGYLSKERVSPADALKAGLVKARENSQGFYDMFRDRLVFPIQDGSDRIIAFGGRALEDVQPKYLNSPETPLFSKNKTLYGFNFARRAASREDRLLVVEGYMDAISAQEAGFENTVATMGTALTEEHVNLIARFTRNVVLSFDADSAGMAAALRSAPVFERAGFNVRILTMPKGEDPDSMLRGGDTSKFAALLERTLPIPDFRVKLALSKYDMRSDEGKAAALREAAAILAEVESAIERERLVRLLARFHPNFATGTTLAEDHLRSEINAFRSRRRMPRGAGVDQTTPDQAPAKVMDLAERSERLLLGIIILRGGDASKVFETLPAKEFSGADTRLLAEAVSRHCLEQGKIDKEMLREQVADTPAEKTLTDLLTVMDDSELNHPTQELVRVIVDHKKNERRQRMRALSEKISEGAIQRGDEEYEEYYRLVRETSSAWRR